MKKKTKEDEIIEYLKPFLKPFDPETSDSLWDNLKYELNEGTLDSSNYLFRENITEADRKEINQMIRLYLLNDMFADKLSGIQRELLLKLNIMHFDWPHSNKLTFDGLSNKLRFGFIPEHIGEVGHDPDLERFHRILFDIFNKFGKDAKASDVITSEEYSIIKEYSYERYHNVDNLQNLEKMGIKDLLFESCHKEFIYDDQNHSVDGPQISTRMGTQKPNLYASPKGIVVQYICDRYWANKTFGSESREYGDRLIREILPERYYAPETYNWLIRDYYYLTHGFFHVSYHLLERGLEVFYNLNIRPPSPLDDDKIKNEYLPYRDYLIGLGYMSKDDATKIELYYMKHHDQDFVKNTHNLYYFVFVVALLFKHEHEWDFNYYLDLIKDRIKKIEKIYSKSKAVSQQPMIEKNSDSTIKSILGDEYLTIHKEMMNAARIESNDPDETDMVDMNLNDLMLSLDLRVRDFKTELNNNMILYCIFYFYIFDGLKLLGRKIAQHRPTSAPEYLYTIIIFLRKRLRSRANNNLILPDFNYAGMSPKVKHFQKGKTSKSSKAKSDSDRELDKIKNAGFRVKSIDDHLSKHRVSTVNNVIDEFIRRFSNYSISSKEIYNKWKNSKKIHLSDLENIDSNNA